MTHVTSENNLHIPSLFLLLAVFFDNLTMIKTQLFKGRKAL